MNIGDMIFQIIMFIFLIGIFAVVFLLVRFLLSKKPSSDSSIEEKLDRIIELLERDTSK
ncbi:uncharacterized protein YggT (Ycf19 family) [Metabacillus crassostreae]|uniref:DUF4083 family protein n=1 Tax=Metabacillus crassostreae TaxID=929098 RepID=UPI001958ADF1|nr:DUF4083 family protein [Metabacillus crassostreae]MBM7602973.1 uncharacterized protein YggT (Ycf19 family) [Metabacillus crassostreae]